MSLGCSRSGRERKQMVRIGKRGAGNDRREARLMPRRTRDEITAKAHTEQCNAAGLRGETVDQQVDHGTDGTFGLYLPVQAVIRSRALSGQINHRDRVAAFKKAATD